MAKASRDIRGAGCDVATCTRDVRRSESGGMKGAANRCRELRGCTRELNGSVKLSRLCGRCARVFSGQSAIRDPHSAIARHLHRPAQSRASRKGANMGGSSWIPNKDADFDTFSTQFKTLIAANPTNYGLSSTDATAITTAWTSFHNAYMVATNGSTRNHGTIQTKDQQKANLKSVMQSYGATIRANHAVSDELKINLGLRVRDVHPTPIPPPSTALPPSWARCGRASSRCGPPTRRLPIAGPSPRARRGCWSSAPWPTAP